MMFMQNSIEMIVLLNIFKRESLFREYKYDNYTIKYNETTILLPGDLIETIIKKRINEIIQYIKSKINLIKKYDYIVLTGGFSNNQILVNEFRNNFKNIHILSNQENSVLKGSLIYLKNRKRINSIILYNTYGLKIPLNEKDNRTVSDIKTLIKKGEVITSDFNILKTMRIKSKKDYFCVDFYKSSNENISSDDYFGTLKMDLTNYKRIYPNEIALKFLFRFNTHLELDISDLKTHWKINYHFERKKCKK